MIEKECKKLSEDILKRVFATWSVPFGNYARLAERINTPTEVFAVLLTLDEDVATIAHYLAESDDDIITVTQLTNHFNYRGKKQFDLLEAIETLLYKGCVYLRRRRGKLSKNEDKIYLFKGVRDAILSLAAKDAYSLPTVDKNTPYNKRVFKEYEKELQKVYELGGRIRYEKKKLPVPLDALLALARGDILSVAVVWNDTPEYYFYIGNPSVRDAIEKKERALAQSIHFHYNHAHIVRDLECFIFLAGESRIRKLKDGRIDYTSLSRKRHRPVTKTITNEALYALANALELVVFESGKELIVNPGPYTAWRRLSLAQKKTHIEKILFGGLKNEAELLAQAILAERVPLSIERLTSEVNRKNRMRLSSDEVRTIVLSLYMIGIIEVGLNEKGDVVMADAPREESEGKCLVNSNYEVVLMNHRAYDDDFIYLLSAYGDLDDKNEIYHFHFSENTVLRGKYLFDGQSKNDISTLLSAITERLSSESKSFPKNIEVTLTRWFDRLPFARIRPGVVLFELDDEARLEEIVHAARKENIEMRKIAPRFALVEGDNLSRRKIVRLFRKQKINPVFYESADTL